MKDTGIFLGCKEKQRDFFGMLKKSSDFFGKTNSEVVIFLGIKYEPLSYPPPPPQSLKFVSGAPGPGNTCTLGSPFITSLYPPLHHYTKNT